MNERGKFLQSLTSKCGPWIGPELTWLSLDILLFKLKTKQKKTNLNSVAKFYFKNFLLFTTRNLNMG